MQQKPIANIFNSDIKQGPAKRGFPTQEKTVDDKGNINFNMKPKELADYLKQFVVNQDHTIDIISTKICTHFNRMRYEQSSKSKHIIGNVKSNSLLIGPTGVGKTFIIKLIAEKLGVPFVKGDATKFSETGYVGGDVEDLVRELVDEANGNRNLAEYGIIYIDEIDKIASSTNFKGLDVSRTGVQRNLLKLMEETEVDLRPPHDVVSQMQAVMELQSKGKTESRKISTKNMLFILSGAFSGIEEIILKRMQKQTIGFGSKQIFLPSEKEKILKNVNMQDLMEFGFESEFVARVPVITVLNELDEEALYRILKSKNSTIVNNKRRDFEAYGIEIDFTDDAFRYITKLAHKEKIGARGLTSVMEKKMLYFEKELPSTMIKEITFTEELLENQDFDFKYKNMEIFIKDYSHIFEEGNNAVLKFTDDAVSYVIDKYEGRLNDLTDFLDENLPNYLYLTKLLKSDELEINKEFLENPGEYVDKLAQIKFKNEDISISEMMNSDQADSKE